MNNLANITGRLEPYKMDAFVVNWDDECLAQVVFNGILALCISTLKYLNWHMKIKPQIHSIDMLDK